MRPFSRAWMTAPSAEVQIPGGVEGVALITAIDISVRSRKLGRENWERERFNLAALLRYLAASVPSLLPATLIRQQSPDFVFAPTNTRRVLAIEHTDAANPDFQRRLDADAISAVRAPSVQSSDNADVAFIGNQPDGWIGDAPEQAWSDDIRAAFQRKQRLTKWAKEPAGAVRCMLIYDLTEADIFVSDLAASQIAHGLFGDFSTALVPIQCAAIVRSAERVLWVGPDPANLLGLR